MRSRPAVPAEPEERQVKFVDEHLKSCSFACPGDPLCSKTYRAQEDAYDNELAAISQVKAQISEVFDVVKLVNEVGHDAYDKLIFDLVKAVRAAPLRNPFGAPRRYP